AARGSAVGCRYRRTARPKSPRRRRTPSARRPLPPSTSPAALPATVGTTSWWLPAVRAGAHATGSSGRRLPKDVAHSAHRVDQPRLTIGFRLSEPIDQVELQRITRGGGSTHPH